MSTYEWKLPLKLTHEESGKGAFLTAEECVIDADFQQDSASILMAAELLPFPEVALPLLDGESLLPVGTEIGWMGYPCVDRDDLLCFFTGRVSAFSHRLN